MARLSSLHALLALLVLLLADGSPASAQSTNSSSIRPSAGASGNSSVSATPTASNSSSVATPSPTVAATIAAPVASASPTSPPPFLATKVEGWNGALAGIMIITSLALLCYGVRSRWTSFFLIGFWGAALPVGMIILHFGVDQALKPPSQSTRGLFLFASLAAGVLLGGACIIWWTGAQYLCGALGCFAVGMFILALRSDGLIRSEAGKYGLLLGLAAVGFAASTVTRLQHSVVLFGCASVGATILILGVDTFTSQNLLQFYSYNIGAGLRRLDRFPLTTAMQVELGVMAAVFLCSVLLQWKFLKVLVNRVKDLREADLKRERKEEQQAIRSRLSGAELEQWEEKYGNKRGEKSEEKSAPKTELLPELTFASAKPQTPIVPSVPPLSAKWANYLSTRKVFVDDRPKPEPAPRRMPSPAELEEGRRSTMASMPLPRPITSTFAPLTSTNQLPRAPSPFNALSTPERSQPSRGNSTPTTEGRTTTTTSSDDVPLAMRDRPRGGAAPPRRQSDQPAPRRNSSSGQLDSGRRSLPFEQPERVPLAMRRESSRVQGISKVDSWRSSMVEPAAAKPKGKHDWLGY